jgi:hypothetical protein
LGLPPPVLPSEVACWKFAGALWIKALLSARCFRILYKRNVSAKNMASRNQDAIWKQPGGGGAEKGGVCA